MRALKWLRPLGLIPTLPERLKLAKESGEAFEDVQLMLLVHEISRRDTTAGARRADVAGLDPRCSSSAGARRPRSLTTAESMVGDVAIQVLSELMSLRFVESQKNVVVLGTLGVGKTYRASALGLLACRSGFNVRFSRADALLRHLKHG